MRLLQPLEKHSALKHRQSVLYSCTNISRLLTIIISIYTVILAVFLPIAHCQQTFVLTDGIKTNGAIVSGNTNYYHLSAQLQSRSGGLEEVFARAIDENDELRKLYPKWDSLKKSAFTSRSLVSRQNPSQKVAYVSVSICSPTADAIQVYVDSSQFPEKNQSAMIPIDEGAALTIHPADGLRVAIKAIDPTRKTNYTYEIGISTAGYLYYFNDTEGFHLDDTDSANALLTTRVADATSNLDNYGASLATGSLNNLSRSLCAIKQLTVGNVLQRNATNRGNGQVSFYFRELNARSQYVAFLYSNEGNTETLWAPTFLQTKPVSGCTVIYNLPFCDKVAYAVPTGAGKTPNEIAAIYDNLANNTFQNFTENLRQFPCNESSNQASYSLVRNCDDCRAAYKDWLCAITIPRCTDSNAVNGVLRQGRPRNVVIEQAQTTLNFGDYKEISPCIDLCYNVVRSCPALFGFGCPENKTLFSSYGERLKNGSFTNGTNLLCNPMDLDWSFTSGVNSLVWQWITLFTIIVAVAMLL
ncbi:1463_t:CDS:2 [Paraglomus occultum]|uniref:1463_t:CDS:1 n=1 Tax=Paraglomus occultum TaxID=144539 RepID=A0A9N8W1Y3_9GLOM|nr:1463_t:CDS:2 [Paraglomus occultum]